MKHIIYLTVIILILASCKKDKHYFKFSDKELDFINYLKGQNIKFIDTRNNTFSLIQTSFVRDFHELISVTGRTGTFLEYYEISYSTKGSAVAYGLEISLNKSRPSLYIKFNNYGLFVTPDSLPTINSIKIDGVTYENVYTITTYKNDQFNNNTDTATLFSNREYGIIQLVFPNGKKIVRTD